MILPADFAGDTWKFWNARLFGWVLFLFSWTPRILFATWQRAGCSRVRQFVRGYVRVYDVQQTIWVSVGGCGCIRCSCCSSCCCCCRRFVALIHIMFPFLLSHLYRPRRTSPQSIARPGDAGSSLHLKLALAFHWHLYLHVVSWPGRTTGKDMLQLRLCK